MEPPSRRARSRRLAVIVAVALAVHAIVLVALDQVAVDWRWDPRAVAAEAPAPDPAVAIDQALAPVAVDVDVVALIDPDHVPPPLAVWGPGDLAGWANTHPLPSAPIDRPGDRAAEQGGGATGGPTVWTGRRDRLDDATLLAEPWNDGADYRASHDRSARSSESVEALHRDRDPESGDRAVEKVARDGGVVASHGPTDGVGAGDGDALWRDADPRFGLKPGTDQAVRKDGATQRTTDPALTDRGAASADVTTRGDRTKDRDAVAAASHEKIPDPYDLTPAQSGGTDRGVDGDAGAGPLTDGSGAGEGATTADVVRGKRDLSIKASPQDPYFRELFARLAKEVTFPRDLAIDLRSGRPIAAFVLAADGTVSDIRLHASSGFRGFDDELVRAVGTLRELKPVPPRLLDGRTRLRILVPYEFRNPVVR